MTTKNVLLLATIIAAFFVTAGCKHDPDLVIANIITPNDTTQISTCNPDTVYFQNDVLPLLISSCANIGCHDIASAEDGVILVDYSSVMQTGEIKPGDPYDSELFEKILDSDPDERMPPPPSSPLTPEQQDIIKIWIEQGALNNYCNADCDTNNVTFSGTVWPMLNTVCVGCHSGGTPSGGIVINDYNSVVLMANNGSLLGSISHDANYIPMPKNGQKLSDCKITEVKIWIEDGTPNN